MKYVYVCTVLIDMSLFRGNAVYCPWLWAKYLSKIKTHAKKLGFVNRFINRQERVKLKKKKKKKKKQSDKRVYGTTYENFGEWGNANIDFRSCVLNKHVSSW